MDTETLRKVWQEAIYLCEIEPNKEEAIQFVKKHENFALFDSMDGQTLLVTFVGLVVFEKKYQLKYGSTTPASHCYMRLLDMAQKGLIDQEFVYDVGDWSAEYSDNSYIPMDNYRGLGPRAYYSFRNALNARQTAEKELSKEKKKLKIEEGRKKVEAAKVKHIQRLKTIERLKETTVEEGIREITKGEKNIYYYHELIEWWLANKMLDSQQKQFVYDLYPEKTTRHNKRLKKHLQSLYNNND